MPLDSQTRLIKLPSVTVSWELSSEPEILGDTAKKSQISAALEITHYQPAVNPKWPSYKSLLFSSEAMTMIVSPVLTRPWIGNNTLGMAASILLGSNCNAHTLFWAAFNGLHWTKLVWGTLSSDSNSKSLPHSWPQLINPQRSSSGTFKIQPTFFLWVFPASAHWLPHPRLWVPPLWPPSCNRGIALFTALWL